MEIFKKKQDYFALSFSDHQLRLAQADGRGRVRTYLEKDLPPGIIERGTIKNRKELTSAVADFLKSAKLKHRFVVVGLPEVRAFTRVLILPPLEVEELDDAARWESESLLPFPLEKAYLDWMILDRTEKAVRALVVALPQGLVESYAQILEELGFQPVAFEITSLSLARLVEKDAITTMIVELKEKEAVLVIVGAGGGIEVSSTTSFKDIKEEKEELFSTIDSLLSFYQKKVEKKDEKKKIAKIIFCGQGAKEEWTKAIEKRTGIKSEILNIKQVNLASIISLARKDVAAPIDEKTINLIPLRIQGLYDRAARVREISAWLKLTLFCLFLVFFSYSVVAARVYFESKKIEGKIIELQASITPETVRIEKKAKLLNSQAQKIVLLSGSRVEVVPLLSLIRQTAPEGIAVTHCSFDGDKKVIFVNGFAEHRDNLLAFKDALEKMDQFSEVHIPLTSLGKEVGVNFSIAVTSQEEGS